MDTAMKLTDDERREATRIGYRGRSGRPRMGDMERSLALFEKDPKGYGDATKVGRAQADEEHCR